MKPIRRVVTGHDAEGRAVVMIDEIAGNIVSQRPLQERCLLWTTDTLPADNDGREDAAAKDVGVGLKGGTVFGVVVLQPGIAPKPHRSDTIDYIVVLSGKVIMQMDEGEVELNAGDVLVQRGTIHNWVVPGPEPVTMAVSMVDAKPVEAAGKVLHAVG